VVIVVPAVPPTAYVPRPRKPLPLAQGERGKNFWKNQQLFRFVAF
jgi:hypothetical protein